MVGIVTQARLAATRLVGNGSLYRVTATRALSVNSAPAGDDQPIFDKILVANRGEIACRVFKTAQKLSVKTVAVYSDADAGARHVAMSDEAFNIGPAPSKESYLVAEKVLDAAIRSGAQAIHPGYGFLSENADFADECLKKGIKFIGPPGDSIRAMGSKSASKHIMEAAGVACVPGYHNDDDQTIETFRKEAERIGYPVMIKAIMGGGGKGMRIVYSADELDEAVQLAKNEGRDSFKDDRILIEKFIERPRHVEFQVFADQHGNCVHLYERDCSVQRRHQKVLEESPAPGMTPELRNRMGTAAVNAAKAVNYEGAGTVEFILDCDTNEFYFMEMNTRLQVEHPVTEMVTGQDLVEWQLKVASGHKLPMTQDEISISGHSIEARVYAEDPNNGFLPQVGTITHLNPPEESENVRVETGVRPGDAVSVYYDPMIAKLVVHANDRASALRRLVYCLEKYEIAGLANNVDFLRKCASHPEFLKGQVDTNFIPNNANDLLVQSTDELTSDQVALGALAFMLGPLPSTYDGEHVNWQDPTSPWNDTTNKRLSMDYTQVIKIMTGEKTLEVTSAQKGANKFELSFDGNTVQATGSVGDDNVLDVVLDNRKFKASFTRDEDTVTVFSPGSFFTVSLAKPKHESMSGAAGGGSLNAPMPGTIKEVLVEPGTRVSKGQTIVVMESMKMNLVIAAPADGIVDKANCAVGDVVEGKKLLVDFTADEE